MEGSQGGSSSPAPFLAKTYELVDDRTTNPIVSWSLNGRSFVVWNPPEFAGELLPKYFKHNNFSSFIRQLNTYGFRKVDAELWEFANDEFIRGQTHLLKNIHRRKPIHSHSAQANTRISLSESERKEFEEEIESLKQENSLLRLDLSQQEQENCEYKFKFQSLESRLQNIDHRQRQVLALVAQLSLKPAFASDLVQHHEIHNKKRRSSRELGDYQFALSRLSNELVDKLDSSINVCEKFLNGISSLHSSQTDTPEISSVSGYNKHGNSNGTANTIYVDILKDSLEGTHQELTPTSVRNGVNDVFWQQFLTEEVESQRREIGIRNGRECREVD